jgi:cytochrome P450
VVFYVGKAVYNVFFHPLRRYPGPLSHKISRIPFLRASVGGTLFKKIQNLHEIYGDVVRVSPDELSYTTPSAWKEIYGHKSQGAPEMAKYVKFYNPNGTMLHIVCAPREEHARYRRLLSSGFSDKAIREQESLIQQYIDLLIKRLHENCAGGNKALDLVQWYNWATFDIIGDLAFGEPFGCLEKSDYHPWISMIFASVKISTFFQAIIHYPLLKSILVSLIPKSAMAKREAHIQLVREKVARRMAVEKERPDFFASILRKKDQMVRAPAD